MFRITKTRNDGDLEIDRVIITSEYDRIWPIMFDITKDATEANRMSSIVKHMAYGDEFKSGSYNYRVKMFKK